jgi:phospholipid/cholesterol/gamma-HCH transport system substrate-binding protein
MVKETKVGLVVAAALAVLMTTIFWLGEQQHLWERKVQYEVRFARTNGLQVGGLVSLTGVTAGSVAEMSFPSDPTESYIQVLVNVTGAVAPRIRENSLASIRTWGLLGDRYIEISAGTADAPPLAPGSVIPSIDPVDYEAILGQSGDIVTNIVEVTGALKTVLSSVERGEGLLGALVRNQELGAATLEDLQRTMANVQSTTKALDQILQRVDRGEGLVGQLSRDTKENRELLASVRKTAQALDTFSAQLNDQRTVFGRLAGDEAYAHRLLENLDHTLGDLAVVSDKVARGEGTLGKLVNDPSLYDNAQGFFGGARRSWLLRLFGLGGGGDAPAPPAAPGGR